MPRADSPAIDLDLVLPDAVTGRPVDLGALDGVHVLTAIRHRY